MKVLFVSGGAGFIGSNFIKFFLRRNKNFIIVNMDKLTNFENLNNLKEIEDSPRHHFVKGDICNYELVNYVLRRYKPDYIINFASSPVIHGVSGKSKNSQIIDKPAISLSLFSQTNIVGTMVLMESALHIWNKQGGFKGKRFIQISSDSVYGKTIKEDDFFSEDSPLNPDTPSSASKAAADIMLRSFLHEYSFPAIITRCCCNYGPNQGQDALVARCILSALKDEDIYLHEPINDVKEWIHVRDHCIAIIRALFYGKPGEIYNIGSGFEHSNLDLAKRILNFMNKPEQLIKIQELPVTDTRRCSLNSYKIKNNLNWSNKLSLDDGLKETISWYSNNFING